MSRVACLLDEKTCGTVHTIEPGSSVLEAARLMNDKKIGSLVVTDTHAVRGIVTERDLLQRVIAAERDPKTTKVAQVMTTILLTCTPETSLTEAREVMRTKRIRHLPVLEDGQLVGMLSIGDLNAAESKHLTATIQTLEAYITSG